MSTFIPLKSGAVYYQGTCGPVAPHSRINQSVESLFKCKKITVSNGDLQLHIKDSMEKPSVCLYEPFLLRYNSTVIMFKNTIFLIA